MLCTNHLWTLCMCEVIINDLCKQFSKLLGFGIDMLSHVYVLMSRLPSGAISYVYTLTYYLILCLLFCDSYVFWWKHLRVKVGSFSFWHFHFNLFATLDKLWRYCSSLYIYTTCLKAYIPKCYYLALWFLDWIKKI